MSSDLAEFFVHCGLFVLLSLIGLAVMRGRVNLVWLVIAGALFLAESAVRTLGWGRADILDVLPGAAPWEGVLLSLALIIAAAFVLTRARPAEAGFTLAQRGPAPMLGWALAVLLVVLATVGALQAAPLGGDVFTGLAFDGVLSPLEAELLYRGVLLFALDRAFSTPVKLLGAALGWGAVISAVLYTAAATSLMSEPGFAMLVEMQPAAVILPFAFLLVWIRAATGSVLAPALVHIWGEASFRVL
ncbi:MAG: CPBP family glutamic-type intramembrane protease [Pseudomonadota bacterium]